MRAIILNSESPQMTIATATDKYNFEKLLDWLGEDRETAGKKYETIRLRLTKIFYVRGAYNAEELADETIERVTKKMGTLADNYEGDPALYFYAVGKRVFLEQNKKPKMIELDYRLPLREEDVDVLEVKDQCLTKCLNVLTEERYEFITEYYNGDKAEKIARRKQMAKEFGITQKALRIRAFRIRIGLKKCIQQCLVKKNSETL